MSVALAFATTWIAAAVLVRFAALVGRDGGGDPAPLARKAHRPPVPEVGGLAICAGLFAYTLAGGGELPWPALLAALALGTLDDVLARGLSAPAKLLGQVAVGALLALAGPRDPAAFAGTVALAVVAQNAANTFDNADGATTVAGCLGTARVPGVLAALLAFLPANLFLRRRAGAASVPAAYLGDAGSHVVGVLLAWVPGGVWALWLPLLDLARVVAVRLASGEAPWVGDRRHLAHRLEAAGLAPAAVAAVLVLIGAPPVLAHYAALGTALHGPAVVIGAALASAFFGIALLATRPAGEAARP